MDNKPRQLVIGDDAEFLASTLAEAAENSPAAESLIEMRELTEEEEVTLAHLRDLVYKYYKNEQAFLILLPVYAVLIAIVSHMISNSTGEYILPATIVATMLGSFLYLYWNELGLVEQVWEYTQEHSITMEQVGQYTQFDTTLMERYQKILSKKNSGLDITET